MGSGWVIVNVGYIIRARLVNGLNYGVLIIATNKKKEY